MTGTTHVPAGVATSLVVLRPTTVTGIIAAVAGGAIGGWICDIDVRDTTVDKDKVQSALLMVIIAGLSIAIDYYHGGGLCDYWSQHWGIAAVAELALLVGWLIIGLMSAHRTFTHSLVGMASSTLLIWLLIRPMMPAYLAGYVSHLILDLPNKKKEQLLWPLDKPRFGLNLCDSDGQVNRIVGGISVVVAFALGAALLIVAYQNGAAGLVDVGRAATVISGVNNFLLYLVAINVITFVVFIIDYQLCMHNVIKEEDEDNIHNFTNLFPMAGGAIGALAAFVLLRQPIAKDTATWWGRILAMLIAWAVIVCVVLDPFHQGFEGIDGDWRAHIILILYLVVINAATIILFIRDFNKRHREFDLTNILMLVLGALGGAAGGYLTITISGRKMQSNYYFFYPWMIAAHTLVIGYLLLAGIA